LFGLSKNVEPVHRTLGEQIYDEQLEAYSQDMDALTDFVIDNINHNGEADIPLQLTGRGHMGVLFSNLEKRNYIVYDIDVYQNGGQDFVYTDEQIKSAKRMIIQYGKDFPELNLNILNVLNMSVKGIYVKTPDRGLGYVKPWHPNRRFLL
jgi:uncharacterized protein YqjF (DUF2071 family)